MEILEIAVQITIIAGFLGAIFSYAILRPLNDAIVKLQSLVQELREDLRRGEDRRHELEIKVAEVDQRARSAHHRIDDIVEICETTHGFKLSTEIHHRPAMHSVFDSKGCDPNECMEH